MRRYVRLKVTKMYNNGKSLTSVSKITSHQILALTPTPINIIKTNLGPLLISASLPNGPPWQNKDYLTLHVPSLPVDWSCSEIH